VHGHFAAALVLVALATLAQLGALARLPPLNTHANLATQLAAKSGGALCALLLAHALGVALRIRAPPGTLAQALAGSAFGLGALVTDPLFGAPLVYGLAALVLGQRTLWATELTYLTLACGAVVLVKCAVFRVY
jgi:hypothetical protein